MLIFNAAPSQEAHVLQAVKESDYKRIRVIVFQGMQKKVMLIQRDILTRPSVTLYARGTTRGFLTSGLRWIHPPHAVGMVISALGLRAMRAVVRLNLSTFTSTMVAITTTPASMIQAL